MILENPIANQMHIWGEKKSQEGEGHVEIKDNNQPLNLEHGDHVKVDEP